jgi:A118 family predicted phage portal protein
MKLFDVLKQLGYPAPPVEYYSHIDAWRSWYRGKVDSFHRYKIYNRGKTVYRDRASLAMARIGCEYWANLLWNDDCHVNLPDERLDKLVNDALKANDFTGRFNRLTERAFALGTGAVVVYPNQRGEAALDFISADMIVPLSWTEREPSACAFAGRKARGDKTILYVMLHEKNDAGGWTISNYYFEESGAGSLSLVAAPEGVGTRTRRTRSGSRSSTRTFTTL